MTGDHATVPLLTGTGGTLVRVETCLHSLSRQQRLSSGGEYHESVTIKFTGSAFERSIRQHGVSCLLSARSEVNLGRRVRRAWLQHRGVFFGVHSLVVRCAHTIFGCRGAFVLEAEGVSFAVLAVLL